GREDDDTEEACQTRCPAAEAVDPDPLPAGRPAAAGPDDGDLDDVGPDGAFDTGQVGRPADELAVGGGPVGVTPGQQHHRLEEARLAGRIGTPDEMRARTERRI